MLKHLPRKGKLQPRLGRAPDSGARSFRDPYRSTAAGGHLCEVLLERPAALSVTRSPCPYPIGRPRPRPIA
jgi:hypothetical protein